MNCIEKEQITEQMLIKTIDFLLESGIKYRLRENNSSVLQNVLISKNMLIIDPRAEYTDVLREASYLAAFQEALGALEAQGGMVDEGNVFRGCQGLKDSANKVMADNWLSGAVTKIMGQ